MIWAGGSQRATNDRRFGDDGNVVIRGAPLEHRHRKRDVMFRLGVALMQNEKVMEEDNLSVDVFHHDMEGLGTTMHLSFSYPSHRWFHRLERSIADMTVNQDELAEGQIPDPGYSGTNNEIDLEGYEFEIYEYFDDLEYGDDSYWDYGLRGPEGGILEETGQKRKRGAAKPNVSPGKRRKTNEDEPLVFRSQSERFRGWRTL